MIRMKKGTIIKYVTSSNRKLIPFIQVIIGYTRKPSTICQLDIGCNWIWSESITIYRCSVSQIYSI